MIHEPPEFKVAVEMHKCKLPNYWKTLPPIDQKNSKVGHLAFKLPNGDFATMETVYKKSEEQK